jgi:hypothetical protein
MPELLGWQSNEEHPEGCTAQKRLGNFDKDQLGM